MQFINTWIQGIIISVVIGTIIEMILPNGNSKKYIKIVIGVYIVFNIINPLISIISEGKIDLNSAINIDKYNEVLSAYKTNGDNLESSNNNNIKELYVLNLKKDIKAKIEDKGYSVISIKIDIGNDENYSIQKLMLSMKKKEISKDKSDIEQSTNEEKNNKIYVNEIKDIDIDKININISVNENNSINKEIKEKNNTDNNLSSEEINDIKEYLNQTYEVNKDKIFID